MILKIFLKQQFKLHEIQLIHFILLISHLLTDLKLNKLNLSQFSKIFLKRKDSDQSQKFLIVIKLVKSLKNSI